MRDGEKIDEFTSVDTLEITYSGNDIPTINVAVDSRIAPYLMRKCELHIEGHGEIIDVEVTGADLNIGDGSISVTCTQLFNEWEKETIPVNIAKKNTSVKTLLQDKEFVYKRHPWTIIFDTSSELNQKFEYEFSRESKPEALDKAINMTTDIMKRIPRNSFRVLEVGKFGQKKEFRVTSLNATSVSMSTDGANIKNMVVPIADKSDGGASSLTLRDLITQDSSIVLDDFPIIDTGFQVNTQAMDIGYDFPQYAPNHKNEFAVIDTYGLEVEDGVIYEGTFSANDLQPIQEDGKKITNADRIKATETLYNTVVRLLKNSRRQLSFTVSLDYFPDDINVLDKIQFAIADCVPNYSACMTEFERNVYASDEWFWVTEIHMVATDCGWTYEVTLAKDLASILGNRVN
jgi:hypothetical protein